MARRRSRQPPAPGRAPGILTAPLDAQETQVIAHRYRRESVESHPIEADAEHPRPTKGSTLWLDVRGFGDVERIAQIGEAFGLHALALEDVLTLNQRAKFDSYEDHAFFVGHVADLREDGLFNEQVAVFLGPDWVITFAERKGTAIMPVRTRLERTGSRLRQRGADYLAYAVIDSIVDHCFPVLATVSERLEALEERAIDEIGSVFMGEVQRLRRTLQTLRRTTWPLRDAVNAALRSQGVFSDETLLFLRDVQDHTLRIVELVESQKELCATLIDLNLSATSNRMNEVMRVLTVISTIFMPLSFVTGLYGMNFDADAGALNMPELRWRFGYFYALGLMGLMVGGLLWYMRRQGWLGGGRARG